MKGPQRRNSSAETGDRTLWADSDLIAPAEGPRTSQKGFSKGPPKVRYLGNHPILGNNPRLEKELRSKTEAAHHSSRAWLVQEDFPVPAMPQKKALRDPPARGQRHPAKFPGEDEHRRSKLLGLPLSYTPPPFPCPEPQLLPEGSCFSAQSLAELSAPPSTSSATSGQPLSVMRLPPLDASGRTTLVASFHLAEEGSHREPVEGEADLNRERPPWPAGHMEQLREERRRVREQRQEQQEGQAWAMAQRLRLREAAAQARDARPPLSRTMESAQLWLTFKQAQEGSEAAGRELPQQWRSVLRGGPPAPHAALFHREDSTEEVPEVLKSPARRPGAQSPAIAVYRHHSPVAAAKHRPAGIGRFCAAMPDRFAAPPDSWGPPGPPLSPSASSEDLAEQAGEEGVQLQHFVRQCICEIWEQMGLPLPSDPEQLFGPPPEEPICLAQLV